MLQSYGLVAVAEQCPDLDFNFILFRDMRGTLLSFAFR